MDEAEKPKSQDYLHGVTLEVIVTELVKQFGWPKLGKYITINCFKENPTIKSSLIFLRRTPWARTKVERLYIFMKKRAAQKKISKNES